MVASLLLIFPSADAFLSVTVQFGTRWILIMCQSIQLLEISLTSHSDNDTFSALIPVVFFVWFSLIAILRNFSTIKLSIISVTISYFFAGFMFSFVILSMHSISSDIELFSIASQSAISYSVYVNESGKFWRVSKGKLFLPFVSSFPSHLESPLPLYLSICIPMSFPFEGPLSFRMDFDIALLAQYWFNCFL